MLSTALIPFLSFLQPLLQGDTPPAAPEAQEGPSFLLPMLAIGAIFWFVMIAPERKRRKERERMVEALKKGDKIMTTSGMYGTIAQVQGEVITVQLADNLRVKFALAAIQGKVDDEAKSDSKKKGADDKTLLPQKGAAKAEASDTAPADTAPIDTAPVDKEAAAEKDKVVESK